MKKTIFTIILGISMIMLSACGTSQESIATLTQERDVAVAEKNVLTEKCDSLQAEYDTLKKENEEFKAIIDPYKDLSAAELLARANEAKLQAKESEQELEKLEKQKAEAEAVQAKEDAKAKEKEEKIGYNTGITFEQLARTPDDYQDKKLKYTGKVVQVLESDLTTQIRLAIDSDYDKMIYIEYDKNIVNSRVLENDTITIYGVSKGLLSYQSTMGGTITIPSVLVDKIDQ